MFYAVLGGLGSFFMFRMWDQASLKNIVIAYLMPRRWFAADREDIMTMLEDDLMILLASSAAPLNLRLLLGCPHCPKIYLSAIVFLVFALPFICSVGILTALGVCSLELSATILLSLIAGSPLAIFSAAGLGLIISDSE